MKKEILLQYIDGRGASRLETIPEGAKVYTRTGDKTLSNGDTITKSVFYPGACCYRYKGRSGATYAAVFQVQYINNEIDDAHCIGYIKTEREVNTDGEEDNA